MYSRIIIIIIKKEEEEEETGRIVNVLDAMLSEISFGSLYSEFN